MDPADRFAELIRRPAAEAHLDLLVALIGAAFDPVADVGEVVLGLDHLAADCRPTFESMLAELFGSGRLRANLEDYGDPRNSFLHQVLQRGLGIPISLSVCAMEVGRRLGLEVHGVGLPGHFLVECEGRFADPFNGGKLLPLGDEELAWRRVTGFQQPLPRDAWRPVSSRAIALRMLNNLKNTYVAMDEPGPLHVLARLRGAFAELQPERAEYARWLRHWN